MTQTPLTSPPFVSSAAGGSTSPDSQTAGGDAAAASTDSTWETCRHRRCDGLPVGGPRRRETNASPACSGPDGRGGNDSVTTAADHFPVAPLVTSCFTPIVGQSSLRRHQTDVSLTVKNVAMEQTT